MKFKTRMINAAVAAALGTVAGAAQAVNLGNDGEGQVLIYPYYTVQTKTIASGGTGPFDTYVTIVNSDSVNGKAVKVRFIEGKASREVLDFNLYLSPNDMWTGAITRCASAGGSNLCLAAGNPMLRTTDNSCTAPEIPIVSGSGSGAVREIAFVNYLYSGTAKDAWNDETLDRAKEGYVEVIQMADIVSPSLTFSWHLHSQSTQIPANCAAIRNAWVGTSYTAGTLNIPTGHLSGAETLINPLQGTDASVDAVALDNFSNVANHQAPGSIQPDLSNVAPATSAVFDGANLTVTSWIGTTLASVAPVSAVIDRNQAIMEYVAYGAPVSFQTDHVVTFPTKRLHQLNTSDIRPFTATLSQNASSICEPVTLTFYNRDETIQSSQPGFSPPPPSQLNQLCYEANVISIVSPTTVSNVLGSIKVKASNIVASIFNEGWLRYGFGNTNANCNQTAGCSQIMPAPALGTTRINLNAIVTTGITATYIGLPVIGFFIEDFVNTSSLAAYGTAYAARYTRAIAP